jgi:microcystin-dependent protein
MSQPYVGEIRMFGGNFAPAGWAFCDGSLIPISENDTLFNLIGTTYGGDGQSTFALPNLQSRVPIHAGKGPRLTQNYIIGETGGAETVTLTTSQLPAHNHGGVVASSDPGNATGPQGNLLANPVNTFPYLPAPGSLQLNGQTLQVVGGSQPHDNMIPFQCISFIISLFGVFPTQN